MQIENDRIRTVCKQFKSTLLANFRRNMINKAPSFVALKRKRASDREEITNLAPKFLFQPAQKLANDGAARRAKKVLAARADESGTLRTAIASIFYFIGETPNFLYSIMENHKLLLLIPCSNKKKLACPAEIRSASIQGEKEKLRCVLQKARWKKI
jgi:hypothetical protein